VTPFLSAIKGWFLLLFPRCFCRGQVESLRYRFRSYTPTGPRRLFHSPTDRPSFFSPPILADFSLTPHIMLFFFPPPHLLLFSGIQIAFLSDFFFSRLLSFICQGSFLSFPLAYSSSLFVSKLKILSLSSAVFPRTLTAPFPPFPEAGPHFPSYEISLLPTFSAPKNFFCHRFTSSLQRGGL